MNGRLFVFARPKNPLLQLAYLLMGGLALIVAFLMGAVVLAVVFGFALVFAAVVSARVWWLRKMRRTRGSRHAGFERGAPGVRDAGRAAGEIIEVEYTVVDERQPRDSRD